MTGMSEKSRSKIRIANRCSYATNTVKPLNCGHLRVLKKLSVIERCPVMGSNLKKINIFETKCFLRYSWHVRYWDLSL